MRAFFMKIIRLIIFISILLCSCKRTQNRELEEIDKLCDSIPEIAISKLTTIDYSTLSERDRHYFDLLTIKANDKAYIKHTSDSIILGVLNYYTSKRDKEIYPQALYYGGRVYSDIGDLTTALQYFQKALDEIPNDKSNLRFRSIILNQTGRLLHILRLDSAAIIYLEKSLEIESRFKNNYFNIAFTHDLLGNCYLARGDKKRAESHLRKAISESGNLSDYYKNSIYVDYARVLGCEGKIDSALNVIRPLPQIVNKPTLPSCLALASEIYSYANILDTAYMYARQLTHRKEPENKRTGYKVIFSDRLRNYVPKDTLINLISEYKKTVEEYLNTHEGENAIIQNTKYNYNIHVRERKKTESKLQIFIIISIIAIVFSLVLLLLIIYNKFRNEKRNTLILTAINLLKEDTRIENGINMPSATNSNNKERTENLSEIKNSILSSIHLSENEKSIEHLVKQEIIDSKIYVLLNEKLKSGCAITVSEENMIWNSLEELIESVSHGFDYRLRILTEGRITPNERKLAMLIKCGFSPLQVSILLGRQKNTISSHRRNLADKITGQKKADKSLDIIIISL